MEGLWGKRTRFDYRALIGQAIQVIPFTWAFARLELHYRASQLWGKIILKWLKLFTHDMTGVLTRSFMRKNIRKTNQSPYAFTLKILRKWNTEFVATWKGCLSNQETKLIIASTFPELPPVTPSFRPFVNPIRAPFDPFTISSAPPLNSPAWYLQDSCGGSHTVGIN